MNVKIPDLWVNVLGASMVLLASSTLIHGFRPPSVATAPPQAKMAANAVQPSIARAPNDSSFSYVAASAPDSASSSSLTAANSNLPPCPTPEQKGTGVLIEGDRPGETTGRKEKIEQVVQQNRLNGRWCTSAKTRNATWNMDGISVDEALRAFDLFKAAGLISLAHPVDSPSPGKVSWQRSRTMAGNQNALTAPRSLASPYQAGRGEPGTDRQLGATTAPRSYESNSQF